jgi:hypothetical protein
MKTTIAQINRPNVTSGKEPQYPTPEGKSSWWALQDLNLGPMDYESTALTAELRARWA